MLNSGVALEISGNSLQRAANSGARGVLERVRSIRLYRVQWDEIGWTPPRSIHVKNNGAAPVSFSRVLCHAAALNLIFVSERQHSYSFGAPGHLKLQQRLYAANVSGAGMNTDRHVSFPQKEICCHPYLDGC